MPQLSLRIVIPVLIAYITLCAVGVYYHEVWLDDVEHFLMARDSTSLSALFSRANYDNHVGLWKIMLFYLTHFISDNPVSIQLLHLVVISSAVFVFLRYAPFTLVTKLLILCGYYFIFEYSLMARNYALGLLFLFIICKLLYQPDKNLTLIGLLMLVMCNTHEFFAMAAVGIYSCLLYAAYQDKKLNKQFALFTLLFLFGIFLVIVQVLNIPADQNDMQKVYTSWLSLHNIFFAIRGIDKGFIPFPALHDPNFWNRYFLESWPGYLKAATSFFFLFFPVWVLRRSRKALIYYIISALLLFVFLVISQMSGARHFGMFFIYFITALWLADYDKANVLLVTKDAGRVKGSVQFTTLFYVILVTQVLAGVFTYGKDIAGPFSQSKNTALFIRREHLDKYPIVVDGYTAAPPLSAYFGRQLYYSDIGSFGGYFIPRPGYTPMNKPPLTQTIGSSSYLKNLDRFILISNRDASDSEVATVPGFQFKKLNEFKGGIIVIENYSIYLVDRLHNRKALSSF